MNIALQLSHLKKALRNYDPGLAPEERAASVAAWSFFYASGYQDTPNGKILGKYLRKIPSPAEAAKMALQRDNQCSAQSTDFSFFVRTYSGDACWLKLLARSLEVFAPEVPVTVCTEEQDRDTVLGEIPARWNLVTETSFAPGTIQQKYSKLTCDLHLSSRYVIFIDSDSVLVKPFDPADWVFDDNPILDFTSYASINEHYRKTGYGGFGVNIWRKGVSHALGATVGREFSRKLEKCYRVEWFKPMREHIEHEHNMSFKSFMGQQKGTGMDGKNIKEDYFFSDFNYMGAFLWEKYRDQVCWLDTDIAGYWSRPVCAAQFHSYSMTSGEGPEKRTTEVPGDFLQHCIESSEQLDEQAANAAVLQAYMQIRGKYHY